MRAIPHEILRVFVKSLHEDCSLGPPPFRGIYPLIVIIFNLVIRGHPVIAVTCWLLCLSPSRKRSCSGSPRAAGTASPWHYYYYYYDDDDDDFFITLLLLLLLLLFQPPILLGRGAVAGKSPGHGLRQCLVALHHGALCQTPCSRESFCQTPVIRHPSFKLPNTL